MPDPTFNPSRGLIRSSWEETPGLPREEGWRYHEFVSEEMVQEYGRIDPASITNLGQMPLSLPSKINPTGSIPVEWDSEGHAEYLADLQRAGSVTNPGGGDAYVHKLAPSEEEILFPRSRTVEVWRDDGMAHLFRGCRTNEVTFELSPENLLLGSIGFAPERGDYMGVADQTSGTSTAPTVRGIPRYDLWEGANRYAWIRVTGAVDAGAFRVKVELNNSPSAAPGFAGVNESTITFGVDSQGRLRYSPLVLSGDGSRFGTRDLEVEAHWPDATGISVGDTWVIPLDRPIWTPLFPDVPKFNEIFARILIGDSVATAEQFEIDSLSMTITRPAEAKHAIGGRFAHRVKERGRRSVSGSIGREHMSNHLRKRMERAEVFWLIVEAYSGEVISNGLEHGLKLISGACLLSGNNPNIGGEDTQDESYDFTCHPSNDETYSDDLTIELTNSIESLNNIEEES